MMNCPEIWQMARTLIERHGNHAPAWAARRAHTLLEAGDIEARRRWMRVRAAAQALLERSLH